jgi:Mn2+/Fe2+ NRAMP family transporter
MGQGAQLVTGIPGLVWVPVFTAVLIIFLFRSSYGRIARVFKWLTLVLLAYVVAAFFSHVDWGEALRATLVPRLAWSREYLSMLLGILGTTISPYLFFWQASQEVEEERAEGRAWPHRHHAMTKEMHALRVDVITGMIASNFIMYFVILTTAATLHTQGKTDIRSAGEAAEALRPFAGPVAYWLFALGLAGTGMLGVPVLAGASSYALAEAAKWRGSLDKKPWQARRFYGTLALGMVLGCLINFMGLDAVKMLFWAAVINGALAPPLILLVILLTSDRAVMGEHVNSPLMRVLGWAAFALMSAAAIGMFLT